MQERIKRIIEYLIFNNRWLLLPFYFKLSWTLLRLAYYFLITGHVTDDQIIETLHDVDVVMIANLVKMIITGSYNSFIDKEHDFKGENTSSGVMKIKLGTSLIGITSIQLLQTFMNAGMKDSKGVYKVDSETVSLQLFVFGAFLLAALILSIIEYLHCKSEKT